MVSMAAHEGRQPTRDRVGDVLAWATLRAFQITAYTEGGLLPAILLVAVVHWLTGAGATAVAVVGALHGSAFTAYLLLVPWVAKLLHWSPRTISVACSVAFVPFAPWTFERRVRADLTRRMTRHHAPDSRPGAASVGATRPRRRTRFSHGVDEVGRAAHASAEPDGAGLRRPFAGWPGPHRDPDAG